MTPFHRLRGARLPSLLALGVLLVACAPAPAAARPNILLLTIDTIRADALGSYGYDRNTSPFLDSLAAESVVYTRAYATSSWTVPSVASMMTGLYPPSHAVVHGAVGRGEVYDQEVLPASLPLLAEELKALGYRTFGVAANTHLGADLGYGRGFDRYLCLGFATADSVNRTVLRWKDLILGRDAPGAGPGSDRTGGNAPWFLWVHYYDPHHPYAEHRPWFRDFVGTVTSADGRLLINAKDAPPKPPRRQTPEAKRFAELARGLYDGEVRYTDEAVRALFAGFGGFDDALVVVAGDHGEEFLEHDGVIHCRTLYEESIRVPLFVRPAPAGGAGGPKPGASTATVSLIDIPTTLLRAAGREPPAGWSGLDLLDRAATDAAGAARHVLAQLERNRDSGLLEALVGPRWKVVVNRLTKREELYDLEKDPGERRNLARSDIARAQELLVEMERLRLSLPAPPDTIERRVLSEEAKTQLKGHGYIR
jgi:arylsulfatase A-like enzyme